MRPHNFFLILAGVLWPPYHATINFLNCPQYYVCNLVCFETYFCQSNVDVNCAALWRKSRECRVHIMDTTCRLENVSHLHPESYHKSTSIFIIILKHSFPVILFQWMHLNGMRSTSSSSGRLLYRCWSYLMVFNHFYSSLWYIAQSC